MAITVNKRAVFLGPMKMEKIWVTSDGTNDDTTASILANVEAASIVPANADLGGTASGASITFSGKTLTLRDAAAIDYVIECLGF